MHTFCNRDGKDSDCAWDQVPVCTEVFHLPQITWIDRHVVSPLKLSLVTSVLLIRVQIVVCRPIEIRVFQKFSLTQFTMGTIARECTAFWIWESSPQPHDSKWNQALNAAAEKEYGIECSR